MTTATTTSTLIIDNEFRDQISALSPDEYQTLEKSLIEFGCLDHIKVWNNTILDGHQRHEICTKHDIPFTVAKIDLLDREAAKDWIDQNQLGRRNLTPDQFRYYLGRRYNRQKKTHGGDRKSKGQNVQLISTAEKLASEYAVAERTVRRAGTFAAEVDANAELRDAIKKGVTPKYFKRDQEKREFAANRAALAAAGKKVKPSKRWCIHTADMETWQTTKKYDFIITDPPYPGEYLPLWEALAKRAKNDWLKEGGLLIAMSGQMYIPQILEMMKKHLDYYWTVAYYMPGASALIPNRHVFSSFKPLLIFKKGEYKGKPFGDYILGGDKEKGLHAWQQPVAGMLNIIKNHCHPGQSILDPFCCTGTTGIAALQHGFLFEGVEINEEDANIARYRLSKESNKINLKRNQNDTRTTNRPAAG